MFSDELTGLPVDREVEFTINLQLGSQPILVAPYRMSCVEMEELRKQIKELQDSEFI